jgi:hypothetical protein
MSRPKQNSKEMAMQSKKKSKKTVSKKIVKKTVKKPEKKKAAPKATLVKSTVLVAKLKKSGLHKTVIARACGYSSHNTVTNWFKSNSVPQHLVKKLTKLAGV